MRCVPREDRGLTGGHGETLTVSVMQPVSSPEMLAVIRERDEAIAQAKALRREKEQSRARRETEDGVTVCVPVYQDHTYLEQTLASVAAQTVPPLEILVINDGSGPAQTETIQALAAKYGAEHYRVTNRGLPNARNTAIMLARGHAFLPLDADDWIEPTYIAKTLPLLEGH
ncbi:MAG: glycosyltransferase family 2 protein, partial [Salinibacterium sp.]